MDPIITNTLLVALFTVLGWMGKTLYQSITDYRTGHKEALQARDEIIADLETQLKSLSRRKKDLRGEYDYFRAWVLAQDALTAEQIAKIPKPPPREQ